MGEVFLARADEKRLVLKRILPHLAANQQFLDLFLDEARILARLSHPNVVRILELGDVKGAWYVAMEYVEGKDLRSLPGLPAALACRIVADAAAGLDAAHKARDAQGRPLHIVHRDVSPHNVLVSFDGAVKVIDFGVAKAALRVDTAEVQGKYPYMSPEQVDGETVDARSDQFSLGIVLWELLTGRRLFKGSSDVQTMQRVQACMVPLPQAAPGVVDAVMRALKKDPARRFDDMAGFASELEPFAGTTAELAAFMGGTRPFVPSEAEEARPPSSPATTRLTLEPHETLALTQLATLPSPFTLEAAEAALDLSSFPRAPWALDVLQALKDKGALRSHDDAGTLRFEITSP